MTGANSRYTHRGDPLRAARLAVRRGQFREAWELLSARKEQYGAHPEWLLLMAMAAWRIGKYEESHGFALEALAEYRSRGDGDGEMRSQNVAAAGIFALGQLDRARSGFARALELARSYDDKIMMARCANNLGNVAYYLGERAEALRQYSLATNLFDQSGSLSGLAEAWHNAGVVLREQGELVAAREAADRAMEAAEQLGKQLDSERNDSVMLLQADLHRVDAFPLRSQEYHVAHLHHLSLGHVSPKVHASPRIDSCSSFRDVIPNSSLLSNSCCCLLHMVQDPPEVLR